ncbi:MAG: hypothetical protein LBC97_11130 [Bifidobacteriaceae bacterium]|jgi:hypothetical protein|nr:hypothetical protein [Bifidobacteriaceae bacterium]
MASKDQIARAIADAETVRDNPFNLGTRGYWAFQDALFDRFMAAKPQRLDELRTLVADTGGPELDGSPESLGLLDDWLSRLMAHGQWDDPADWLPVWARLPTGAGPLPLGLERPPYYRLQERLAFYLGDVLISQLPGSQWVCWREREFNLNRTGEFLLDKGTFPTPAAPLDSAASAMASVWPTLLDPSDRDYEPTKKYTLRSEFDRHVLRRLEWEAEGRPLDFQAAPTGDGAGVNRGPYKGSRIRAKIGERRGY